MLPCDNFFSTEKIFNLDPRQRHTLLNVFMIGLVNIVSLYGTNQAMVQRAQALKNSSAMIL